MHWRERTLLVLAALLPAAASAGPADPVPCPVGLVWRGAVPNDFVCVPPATRERTAQENARGAQRHAAGSGELGPDTCRHGFVWRDAFPGDHVCVVPAARDQAAQDNRASSERTGVLQYGPNGPYACRQGFVWREARPGDVVCVTPRTREEVRADNALAASRRGNDVCLPGFVWRGSGPSDFVCVTPPERAQAARDSACSAYAITAVAQQQANLGQHCGLSGDRWSGDVVAHFQWCAAAAQAQSDFERGKRDSDLTACARRVAGGGGGGGLAPGPGRGDGCCWRGVATPSGIATVHECPCH